MEPASWFRSPFLLVEAKGVAGLGKAGGDGQAGSDKAGQQVPPEVYMALTYAGTLFLFTLSVPLILYGLNKLLNKIEECFGCGASSKEKKAKQLEQSKQHQKELQMPKTMNKNHQQQPNLVNDCNDINNNNNGSFHPDNNTTRQYHNNQRLNLQLLQQHPKYSQFISMSSKPEYNHMTSGSTSPDRGLDLHQAAPLDAARQQQVPGQDISTLSPKT